LLPIFVMCVYPLGYLCHVWIWIHTWRYTHLCHVCVHLGVTITPKKTWAANASVVSTNILLLCSVLPGPAFLQKKSWLFGQTPVNICCVLSFSKDPFHVYTTFYYLYTTLFCQFSFFFGRKRNIQESLLVWIGKIFCSQFHLNLKLSLLLWSLFSLMSGFEQDEHPWSLTRNYQQKLFCRCHLKYQQMASRCLTFQMLLMWKKNQPNCFWLVQRSSHLAICWTWIWITWWQLFPFSIIQPNFLVRFI